MSLKVSNLKKSFAQGESRIEVLKGLNLDVASGKIVAILGQSGAGKSTFLGLLSGLDQPDSGTIEIGGQNVTSLTPEQRTLFRGKNIGIVFQQFHLVPHLSALENVALPLEIQGESNVEDRARKMLESLGLGHRLHHHPGTMSGGECQRVAIARALVGNPSLILADEPSGNLDLETGEKVTQVFFDQIRKSGITTILVTHNPELAKLCDERFALRGGLCVPA